MRFKVLVYQNVFVDESRLECGIYATPVPDLHSKSITIKKLIGVRKHILGLEEDDIACENLRKCVLIKCDLLLEP